MGLNEIADILFLSPQLLNFCAHVNRQQLLGEMQGIFAKKIDISVKTCKFYVITFASEISKIFYLFPPFPEMVPGASSGKLPWYFSL
jgi:hypothetical protein